MKNNTLKKLTCAFLVTSTVLTFCSCSQKREAGDGYEIGKPEGNDYSFEYPASWNVIRNDSMFAIRSEDLTSTVSACSFEVGNENSVREYIEKDGGYEDLLKETFGSVEILSVEDTTLGKGEAAKIIYHIKIGDDDYHFCSVLSLFRTDVGGNTYLYDLTFTSDNAEHFEKHLPAFEGMTMSFEYTSLVG